MSTAKEQAQAHADLLLSTGMAYEITPHTIAYRAFLDGFTAGAANLASNMAELAVFRAQREHVNQLCEKLEAEHARVMAKHPDAELLDSLQEAKVDLLYTVMDDQDGEPTRRYWVLEGCDASKYRHDVRSAIIDGLAAMKEAKP